MKKILKQFNDLSDEVLETVKHQARLSTLFDVYLEKIIPSFVNEKDLKEYYENKMEQVNDFIYKL